MSRIFITSLGLGDYHPVAYEFGESRLDSTAYVQRALIEAHREQPFDRIVLLLTDSARKKHWSPLERPRDSRVDDGLRVPTLRAELGLPEEPGLPYVLQPISEKIEDRAEQWNWFQAVLSHVDHGDELFIDMTHGFRMVPIVLSAALHYLQAIKGARLVSAWYAADQKDGCPIVDFADFYALGQWADGVSRLIENADAGKLAALAASSSDNRHFPALNRRELVEPLQILSGILKNVDVNAVGAAAENALSGLRRELERLGADSVAERQMIELVVDKFAGLTSDPDPTGRYDRGYFDVQLEMARMLLVHGFLMQAFTVLRETLAAVGMVGLVGTKYEVQKIDSDAGRKSRRNFGEAFVCMLQYPVADWDFREQARAHVETLRPFFDSVMATGTGVRLGDAVRRLVQIRNGFDHAWTSVGPGKRPTPERLAGLADEGEQLRVLLGAVVGEIFATRG
jgi:CRISPR-associated Csx2 family protein